MVLITSKGSNSFKCITVYVEHIDLVPKPMSGHIWCQILPDFRSMRHHLWKSVQSLVRLLCVEIYICFT